jgi:hypothetical protein
MADGNTLGHVGTLVLDALQGMLFGRGKGGAWHLSWCR